VSRPEKRGKKAAKPGKSAKASAPAKAARSSAVGLALRVAGAVVIGAGIAGLVAWGCSGWDPRSPFERNAPAVEQAIRDLDAGNLASAEEALEAYLGTGVCADGGIALPPSVHDKPSGSFDLGLTLFYLAERFGHRFGDEDQNDGGQSDELLAQQRSSEVDCALLLVKAIAGDVKVPLELRARAHYLAGNLEFLRAKYEEAVKEYDLALGLVPGLFEEAGGDGIGRDAAWNRAIALRRIEEQKDAGNDANDASDGDDGSDGSDAAPDGSDGGDAAPDGGDGGDGDAGGKDGGGEDGGKDGGDKDGGEQDAAAPQPQDQRAKPEPSPPPQQDERMLDKLEEAPTYQEQEARSRAGLRRGKQMEDK
jgi:tetratricopeptide (TPR) repeat protein